MKKIVCLVLAVCILGLTCLPGDGGAEAAGYEIDTPYEYPLKPGTDEWFSYTIHELWGQLQVPEDILDRLTTRALAETVVNFPFLPDMFLSSSDVHDGYEFMRENYNGLKELEEREDGMTVLLEMLTSDSFEEIGDLLHREAAWAVLLLSDRSPLAGVSAAGLDRYAGNEELESAIRFCKVCGGLRQFEISTAAETVTAPKTPSGNAVKDDWWYYDGNGTELSPAEIKICEELVREQFGLEPLRPATAKYNCHSYAWYDRSESNKWWICYPIDFMEDPYYTLSTRVSVGDIVVYRMEFDDDHSNEKNYKHSAVVVNVGSGSGSASNPPVTVVSKWGSAGLYEHNIYKCPDDYGRHINFYTVA